MRILREPLVQFLALGAGIFALFWLQGDPGGDHSDRIVVTAGQVEHLATGFARTWLRPPTAGELEGLVDDWVREEIYYRQAMALGLDRDDRVVRRRLRQKMEFLTEEAAAPPTPSDEELRTFLREHPEAFRVEPRFAFRQVCLDRDRRGDTARSLLDRLTASGPDADLAGLGDRLMLPDEVPSTPRAEIVAVFGAPFADRLEHLEPGRWTGPVESGYGLHLVLVRERVPGRLPELDEVRDAVEREWLSARRATTLEAAYRQLRERYIVVVEPSTAAGEAALP